MDIQEIKKIVRYEIQSNEHIKQYENDLLLVSAKIVQSFIDGHRLYICGNGGSSADASHIAAEFIKDFNFKRNKYRLRKKYPTGILEGRLQYGLPAFSLSDTSIITAISNDIDYSLIYAQQIFVYGNVGDILILLSTSGNSENVVNAAITARNIGITTIGFTGKRDNQLQKECSYTIRIDNNTVSRIQEGYMILLHTICAIVEKIIYIE